MPEDGLLQRIDVHMARGNELMEQNRRAFEDNRTAFEDLGTVIREMTLRQEKFMRELSLRQEKLLQELSLRQEKVLGRQEKVMHEMVAQLREHGQMLQEGRREFVEESRAQRAALFRMLDRLGGGDSPAAT